MSIGRQTRLFTSAALALAVFASGAGRAAAQERGAALMGLESVKASFGLGVSVNHASRIYHPGDRLVFEVSVDRRDAYVFAIYQTADGDMLLLFPNAWAADNRIPAGSRIQVPPRDARFEIVITGQPLGLERLKVFAVDRPLTRDAAFDAVRDVAADQMQPLEEHQKGVLVQGLAELNRLGGDLEIVDVALTVVSSDVEESGVERRLGAAWGAGIPLGSQDRRQQLPYAAAEAEAGAAVLERHGGFEFAWTGGTTTAVFVDERATKRSFIESIEALSRSTSVGDWIVLYVSSHASLVDDADNDEQDRRGDEAIAFFDATMTDDELGVLLRAVWGRKVVLVLDTCFAGGFTTFERGGQLPQPDLDFFNYENESYARDIDQPELIVLACTSHALPAPSPAAGQSPFAVALQDTLQRSAERGESLTVAALHKSLSAQLKERGYRPVLAGDLAMAECFLIRPENE